METAIVSIPKHGAIESPPVGCDPSDVLVALFTNVVGLAITVLCLVAFILTGVVLLPCWPHAVSANAKLLMHIEYRTLFIFPSYFCVIRLDNSGRAAIRR